MEFRFSPGLRLSTPQPPTPSSNFLQNYHIHESHDDEFNDIVEKTRKKIQSNCEDKKTLEN